MVLKLRGCETFPSEKTILVQHNPVLGMRFTLPTRSLRVLENFLLRAYDDWITTAVHDSVVIRLILLECGYMDYSILIFESILSIVTCNVERSWWVLLMTRKKTHGEEKPVVKDGVCVTTQQIYNMHRFRADSDHHLPCFS